MAPYIVLRPVENSGVTARSFVEIGRVEAGSPSHAVEQVAHEEGEYVAVPEGRFKILRVGAVQAFRVIATE